MKDALKPKIARIGMTVGVIGFISGGFISCACPGWFVCTGIAFVFPILYGTNFMRVIAAPFLIGCVLLAVSNYKEEQALAQRLLELRMKWQKQKQGPQPH